MPSTALVRPPRNGPSGRQRSSENTEGAKAGAAGVDCAVTMAAVVARRKSPRSFRSRCIGTQELTHGEHGERGGSALDHAASYPRVDAWRSWGTWGKSAMRVFKRFSPTAPTLPKVTLFLDNAA